MKRAVVLCLLAACKSQGTIDLDFDLATCGVSDAGVSYVLYAEPRTSCADCACGGCAGAEPDEVVACEQCSAMQIHGASLDLKPGLWAVVLASYAPNGSNAQLLATQCYAITVDADGTQSSTPTGRDDHCSCSSTNP